MKQSVRQPTTSTIFFSNSRSLERPETLEYQKFLEYMKFNILYSLPSKVILRPLFQNQKDYQKYFSKLKLNLRIQKTFGRIVRQLRLAIR